MLGTRKLKIGSFRHTAVAVVDCGLSLALYISGRHVECWAKVDFKAAPCGEFLNLATQHAEMTKN